MRKSDRNRSRKNARHQAAKALRKEREARAAAQKQKQRLLLAPRHSRGMPNYGRALETLERAHVRSALPSFIPPVLLHPFPHDDLVLVIDFSDLGPHSEALLFARDVCGVPMIDIIPKSLHERLEIVDVIPASPFEELKK